MAEITDPDILARFSESQAVTDPDVLARFQAATSGDQSFGAKFGRFLSNVYNNPPPSAAFIRDVVKGAPGAATELTYGADPQAAAQAAGTMFSAATLGTPLPPGLRAGEGVFARPITREQPPAAIPARPTPPTPPTAQALKTEREINYKTAAESGVEIAPQAARDVYQSAGARLMENFERSEAPMTYQILDNAANRVAQRTADPLQAMTGVARSDVTPLTGSELEAIQKRLRAVKGTQAAPGDAAAARQVRAAIDEAVANLADNAFLAGDADVFRSSIASGRGNTAAMYRLKALEAADERAALQAATTSMGGNVENTARQSFKSLVRPPVSGGPSPAQRIGFNEAEQQAIRDIADPGLLRSVVRGAGHLAPTDPWKIAAHTAAAHGTAGASLLGSGAAYGAKKLGDYLTDASINRAMALTGARSPLYRQQYGPYAEAMQRYQAALGQAQRAQAAARQQLLQDLAGRAAFPAFGENLPPTQRR